MRKKILLSSLWTLLAAVLFFGPNGSAIAGSPAFTNGTPEIRSMSALAFAPQGVLLIGDSRSGAIFAVDLKDKAENDQVEPKAIPDIEAKIAGLLGTKTEAVMIHDMAVNPISKNIYLACSRGRAGWDTRWELPNDVADANVLLRVTPAGEIDEVSLKNVSFSRAELPNPVDESKTHRWKKGLTLRVDAITDLSYANGMVYVAGLSNEEFSSAFWKVPYPFTSNISATTVEIYHGAHGKYETHAPIRTFVPYKLKGEEHLLAAYLCTPFVTFKMSDLKDKAHLKGRTIAEFGSGNYPLDMIVYEKNGKEFILIANSNLPFMVVDPEDIQNYEGEIVEEVAGYTAGVKFESRSGTGIQHLDNFSAHFLLALQRMPGGKLDLAAFPVRRF